MRILIIGCNGQLGTDLQRVLAEHDVIASTHGDLEITDEKAVRNVVDENRPDVVINTAAYHKVDECESYPDKTFAVNALGPRNLAQACKAFDGMLIHFSTNFVFEGDTNRPYTEEDLPGPLSLYGVAKLSGELLVRSILPRHLIVRTTGLYGIAGSGETGKGLNFIELMIKLGKERGAVTVVDDQMMTPTSTSDLAEVISCLIDKETTGTYHITNSGACSYFEFARTIFEKVGMSAQVSPISTGEYGAPARRPLYSVLDNSRLHVLGVPPLRQWDEALEDYLHIRGYL